MYFKSELRANYSLEHLLKLLRKNPAFSQYCTQKVISKGEILKMGPNNRQYFYMVEQGYFSFYYENEYIGKHFIFFVQRDTMINFLLYKEHMDLSFEYKALSDVLVWEVDFAFLRSMILEEDPRNHYQLNYISTIQTLLFHTIVRQTLDAKRRVIYCLVEIAEELSLYTGEHNYVLPDIVTYDLLAEFAGTSRGYTSRIIKELRDLGLLSSSRKPWIIKDLPKLKKLLHED
ncbi:Crp/Fnr family transcriptional regulator [Listeria booriae]|uniref:Crp/Fnr family transcriptional regulator n=1 Tax=Listeria booriae TaxID=1552123 RepID=UPI001623B575|nr:Crp/Fnr family transcriptional regulator [Listeria booriae]MBC2098622.1 Crp/Fnr family transcriptional regulator [Listeria booriae]